MIEFGAKKFGHPWHGIWRAETGKVTSPTGVQFTPPGNPPYVPDYLSLLDNGLGAATLLQKPGLPVPTTAPAEAAKGMSWTNYAILSGLIRRLYGRSLGADWIYFAPDGSRWLVSPGTSVSGSGASLTVSVSLSFKRFGEIGAAAANPVQSLNVSTAMDVQSYAANGFGNGNGCGIEDINPTGSRALLGASKVPWLGQVPGGYAAERWIYGITELVIAGTPPAATATLTVLASDASGCWDQVQRTGQFQHVYFAESGLTSVVNDSPSYLPQGMNPYRFRRARASYNDVERLRKMIGARYQAGSPQVIYFDVERRWTGGGSISSAGSVWDRYKFDCSGQMTYTAKIIAGGSEIQAVSYAISSTSNAVSYLDHELDWGLQFETTGSCSWTGGVTGGTSFSGSSEPFVVGTQAEDHYDSGQMAGFWAHPVRYSPTTYGLVWKTPQLAGSPESWTVGPVSGAIGSDGSTLVASSLYTAALYASEHPVTGQIVRSTSPVCWV